MSTLKFLRDVLAVAGNEFLQFRRNRTAILVSLVVLPLFFTASLGSAQGGAVGRFSATANIPIAFVDNDFSIASGRLLQTLVSSGDFSTLVQGYREENGIAALGTGQIYAVIVVPKGFQKSLENNQTSNIVVYTDDGEPGLSDTVQSTLSKDVRDFNPNVDVQAPVSQSESIAGVEVVRKGAVFSSFSVGLTVVLAVVQIFATFYEIAGGMSKEREEGTYARLLMSPTSIGSIVLGKTLYDLGLGTIRTFIVLGLGIYGYGARPNTDIGTLVALSLLIGLITMGFGFLVSSLRVGTRAVVIIEFFLILFMFAFSGFIIDRELLRGISQTISYLLPWAYGIDALKRTILIGQPLLALTTDLQFVLAAILVFYGIAYVLLILLRERLVV
jgi:ABC-2 type transport system permease protein